MTQRTTLASISRDVITEAQAYAHFEMLRWGDTPVCAHCESTDVAIIKSGTARRTRTGAISERRVWNCRSCRKQFSVLTNTVMHGTKIPVRTWLMVTFEMCADKNGISAREVGRKYGLAERSAWFMCHRIREAMSNREFDLFSGNVVADETYIGGSEMNKHRSQRHKVIKGRATLQTPVVTVIDADQGVAHSEVTPDAGAYTLGQVIRHVVDVPMATLHTDKWRGYQTIGSKMAGHYTVDHSAGEYVNEKSLGTQKAEGYFSQLKRSIDGTHHHVTRAHLPRYLAEFDYRYSTRKMTDAERMQDLAKQVAGRLTYAVTKASA